MIFHPDAIKNLSKHLQSYDSRLYMNPTNKDLINDVVTAQLAKGNNSFLTSMSLENLRLLLLLKFNDLNDQLIQAIPKTKVKALALNLRNIDFAEVLYSLNDVNNRKFLIDFLTKVRKKRWNFIFEHDLKLSKDNNSELSILKKHLETLENIKLNLSSELEGLKAKSEEIRRKNNEYEAAYSDHDEVIKSWLERISAAENSFKRAESKRQAINKSMNEREEALLKREQEISEENQRLLKQKVEQSLPGYIRKTQALLKAKERAFSKTGKNWSYVGIACVLIAIYCGIFFTLYSFEFINSNQNLEWKYLLINIFKGGLVVGVFLYIAQHAFNVSNAYVHESIQRSDKRHAINFGELFLKIYGSSLQRDELLKVFENWNISTDSAFKKIQHASMSKEFASLLSNLKPEFGGKEKKSDAD